MGRSYPSPYRPARRRSAGQARDRCFRFGADSALGARAVKQPWLHGETAFGACEERAPFFVVGRVCFGQPAVLFIGRS